MKRLFCLTALLTVSVLFSSSIEAVSQTEKSKDNTSFETESLADKVARLERKYRIEKKEDQSVIARIEILEIEVFGTTKNGSLVDRIQSLSSQSLESSSAKPFSTNAKQKDGERLETYLKRLNETIPYINTSHAKFFRIAPASNNSSGDYLNNILKATKNKVLRFAQMPIPVYITPQRHSSYTNACIKGFEEWEARTNGNIRFVQVDEKKQARIIVIWKQLGMSKDKNNCALGAHTVTKWKKRGKGKVAVMSVGAIPIPLYLPRFGPKYKVPAQIIEVNMDLIDSKRQDIKFLVLQNIVTHELGHALGMLGHSSSRLDMMYPVTDEHSRISQRDLNTLSKLYQMKVDIPL